jgi:putative peptide zinc metalloprotease protein
MIATACDAAESRPLLLRARPDLAISEQWLRGQRIHVVKDPVSLKYFHLSEEESFLIGQLNGAISLEEVCKRYESRFAPRRITPTRLHSYLGQLHREGLLIGTVAGQANTLLERDRDQVVRQRWMGLFSLLAMRFRGVNPTRLLDALYPCCRWLFSPIVLAGCLAFLVSAMLLVASHWHEFTHRLPEFEAFFSGGNLIWLAIVLAGIKVVHELGHALTLKHFGGECPEIGPMLLLCLPCLYCNTTDAWMLPSKWQRAAVAAAGIGVELLLASLATFLWWFSEPGLFNSLCLNVMLICSVSTVLFNGNPLLRYDGYYVLSDLLEVPNLAQQASEVIRKAAAQWFAGVVPPKDRATEPTLPTAWLIAFFASSAVYRVFVVMVILWTLHLILKPLGLDAITGGVAILTFGGLLIAPVVGMVRIARDPRWSDRVKFRRLVFRSLLVTCALGLSLMLPLPMRVTAPAVLRPADAERVYATVEGSIVDATPVGQHVEKGQTILQLKNAELSLALERARGERDRQALHLKNLRQQAIQSPTAEAELPAAEAALSDLEQRLRERESEIHRLNVAAPRAGIILQPPLEASSDAQPHKSNERFLDEANCGKRVPRGSLICLVGDDKLHEAIVLVEQSDVELVQPGQRVWLAAATYPGKFLQGAVTEVSPARNEDVPDELLKTNAIPQGVNHAGKRFPMATRFEVRVQLPENPLQLTSGTTATARIEVPPKSAAERLFRFLTETFRIRW